MNHKILKTDNCFVLQFMGKYRGSDSEIFSCSPFGYLNSIGNVDKAESYETLLKYGYSIFKVQRYCDSMNITVGDNTNKGVIKRFVLVEYQTEVIVEVTPTLGCKTQYANLNEIILIPKNSHDPAPICSAFNPVHFVSTNGEPLSICMRDGGFEIKYHGGLYEFKGGKVSPMKVVADGCKCASANDLAEAVLELLNSQPGNTWLDNLLIKCKAKYYSYKKATEEPFNQTVFNADAINKKKAQLQRLTTFYKIFEAFRERGDFTLNDLQVSLLKLIE